MEVDIANNLVRTQPDTGFNTTGFSPPTHSNRLSGGTSFSVPDTDSAMPFYSRSRIMNKRKRKQKTRALRKKKNAYRPRRVRTYAEVKKIDNINSLSSSSGTPNIVGPLTLVPKGTANNQRIGSKITLQQWKMHMLIGYDNDVNASQTQLRRIIIFQWPGGNEAPQNVSDVLETASGQPSGDQFRSPYRSQSPTRYRILYDQNYVLTDAYQIIPVTYKYPRNSIITFDSDGNPTKNHIYMIILSYGTSSVGAEDSWTIRMKYTDT